MNENRVTPAVAASGGSGARGGTSGATTSRGAAADCARATLGASAAAIMIAAAARRSSEAILESHDEAPAVHLTLDAVRVAGRAVEEAEYFVIQIESLNLKLRAARESHHERCIDLRVRVEISVATRRRRAVAVRIDALALVLPRETRRNAPELVRAGNVGDVLRLARQGREARDRMAERCGARRGVREQRGAAVGVRPVHVHAEPREIAGQLVQ